MDRSIASRLRTLLDGAARSRSVRDLKREGISKVPVLGRDQLAALVEEAVAETLKDRGLLDERGEVAREATERAKGLLREVSRLEAEAEGRRRTGAEIERRVNELRREVVLAEANLRDARRVVRDETPPAPGTAELVTRVRALLAAGRFDPDAAAGALAAEIDALIAANVAQAVARARSERGSEVEDLDRRVLKLRRALEKAEADLALAGEAPMPGIASIYRTIQGLDARAKDFTRKLALLEHIFQANVRLQGESA